MFFKQKIKEFLQTANNEKSNVNQKIQIFFLKKEISEINSWILELKNNGLIIKKESSK